MRASSFFGVTRVFKTAINFSQLHDIRRSPAAILNVRYITTNDIIKGLQDATIGRLVVVKPFDRVSPNASQKGPQGLRCNG